VKPEGRDVAPERRRRSDDARPAGRDAECFTRRCASLAQPRRWGFRPIAAVMVLPSASTARRIRSAQRAVVAGPVVAEQLPDDGQPEASARAHAGEGMSQIVNAKSVEPRRSRDRCPRLLEIGARRAFFLAGNDVLIALDARQVSQDGQRRRRQEDALLAGFRRRQVRQPSLVIDLGPLRRQNLVQPAWSRRRRRRTRQRPPFQTYLTERG
jgi:hypothetical protein